MTTTHRQTEPKAQPRTDLGAANQAVELTDLDPGRGWLEVTSWITSIDSEQNVLTPKLRWQWVCNTDRNLHTTGTSTPSAIIAFIESGGEAWSMSKTKGPRICVIKALGNASNPEDRITL